MGGIIFSYSAGMKIVLGEKQWYGMLCRVLKGQIKCVKNNNETPIYQCTII